MGGDLGSGEGGIEVGNEASLCLTWTEHLQSLPLDFMEAIS